MDSTSSGDDDLVLLTRQKERRVWVQLILEDSENEREQLYCPVEARQATINTSCRLLVMVCLCINAEYSTLVL